MIKTKIYKSTEQVSVDVKIADKVISAIVKGTDSGKTSINVNDTIVIELYRGRYSVCLTACAKISVPQASDIEKSMCMISFYYEAKVVKVYEQPKGFLYLHTDVKGLESPVHYDSVKDNWVIAELSYKATRIWRQYGRHTYCCAMTLEEYASTDFGRRMASDEKVVLYKTKGECLKALYN